MQRKLFEKHVYFVYRTNNFDFKLKSQMQYSLVNVPALIIYNKRREPVAAAASSAPAAGLTDDMTTVVVGRSNDYIYTSIYIYSSYNTVYIYMYNSGR